MVMHCILRIKKRQKERQRGREWESKNDADNATLTTEIATSWIMCNITLQIVFRGDICHHTKIAVDNTVKDLNDVLCD